MSIVREVIAMDMASHVPTCIKPTFRVKKVNQLRNLKNKNAPRIRSVEVEKTEA